MQAIVYTDLCWRRECGASLYTRAPWQVAIDIVIGDALLGAAVVAIACRILFGNRKP